jgi:dTDP-4-dehydrorhamnose reductase
MRSPPLHEAVRLDIRDREQVCRVLADLAPAAIIHCAALVDFDRCAVDRTLAWDLNVRGTEHLARAAREIGARFVYVSTDLVFRGDRGDYTEQDEPEPICEYGKTKFAAERIVGALCPDAVIARPALIYGFGANGRTCFAERLLQNLRNGEPVNLFQDEYRSPIDLPTLCEQLLALAASELQGIYHLGGPERLSRFEFGWRLAEAFGLDPAPIRSASYRDHDFVDPRPADCSLRSEKAARALHLPCPSLTESLQAMREYAATQATANAGTATRHA